MGTTLCFILEGASQNSLYSQQDEMAHRRPLEEALQDGMRNSLFFALAAGWVFSPPRSCRIHCKVNDKNSLPLMRRCDSSSRRHRYCCYWQMHKMLLAILPHPTEAVGLEAVITLGFIAISHTFWVLETFRDSK